MLLHLSRASKLSFNPYLQASIGRMVRYCQLIIARRGLHPSQGFCHPNVRNVKVI